VTFDYSGYDGRVSVSESVKVQPCPKCGTRPPVMVAEQVYDPMYVGWLFVGCHKCGKIYNR